MCTGYQLIVVVVDDSEVVEEVVAPQPHVVFGGGAAVPGVVPPGAAQQPLHAVLPVALPPSLRGRTTPHLHRAAAAAAAAMSERLPRLATDSPCVSLCTDSRLAAPAACHGLLALIANDPHAAGRRCAQWTDTSRLPTLPCGPCCFPSMTTVRSLSTAVHRWTPLSRRARRRTDRPTRY